MPHELNNLQRPKSNTKRKKRVGRGNASGKGTYATRGLKGQRSRSGGRQGLAKRSVFKQVLIRTPKLSGFNRASATIAVVNLAVLNDNFKDGDIVTKSNLIKKGLIRATKGGVKVLGSGTIDKKLTLKLNFCSETAKKAIEKAGGKVEKTKKTSKVK